MRNIEIEDDSIVIENENGNLFSFDVPVVINDDGIYEIPQNSGEVYVYPRRVQYVGGGPLVEIYLEAEEMEVLENLLEKFNQVQEINPIT